MTKTTMIKCVLLTAFLCCSVQSFAQVLLEIGEKSAADSLLLTSLRSKNGISVSAGSTLLNGDFNTPDYENFLELQLKRFVTTKIAISGNVKKFDIKNYDFEDQGFLSGDLNAEWYILSNHKLTPYVFAGPGILLSNDFKDQNYKVQGGVGLEYLLIDCLAILGALEANYIYDEQNGSMLLQEADQLYYNARIGLLFYFGNRSYSKSSKSKKRLSKNEPSIIKSNTIGYY
ncbi:hypothetical protein [Psychroserpens sp. SPM9]|uniref:hypothetical protein n=1 Tax=Psychroserpens sp. SPM9 TaxID=2975598 RepID=UPI0021A72CE8|nr:hypothetical protein [Psychroserpens sp. SPM9]MDG5492584.1 hypothetical protein [Psychroserpens sp. SPM9]